jgi:predicted nucleic acid-binding Zn ribbon protein
MKNKNTTPLKEALEDFFKEKKWGTKIKGYQIISHWGDLVAREVAQNSQPIKIQNQCLFLSVKSNVWANELNLRKGEIIQKINLKAEEEIISNILFKVQPSQFND